jgi:SAM-dependent methyltransferase
MVRLLHGLIGLLTCLPLLVAGAACAQPAADYKPELAQPGKDVVWVPTPDALVNRMLDLAQVGASDIVIDLGSGDGRLVIMAAKRGAKALGIEYDAKLVAYAKAAAAKADVADRAQFTQADLFASDISQASVVTLFLGADLNRRLMPKLLDLKPGTRIVSNTHAVGDWPADGSASSADDDRTVYYRTALLWIVPAKAAGTWRFADGSANITQRFQKVSGSVTAQGKFVPISGATLRGDQISFSAGGTQYSGTVAGDTIAGTAVSNGQSRAWRATRGSK